MKKGILLLFSVLVIISCSKQNNEFNRTTDKVIKVETHNDGNNEWTVTYHYENDQLVLVEDLNGIGQNKVINYDEDKVHQILTYTRNDNKLVFKEEFIYNSDGSIDKIDVYSINAGADLPLSRVYEMSYNNDGLVKEVKIFNVSRNEYSRRTEITWDNGNATIIKEYSEQNLQVEYINDYDDKINYKQNLPTFFKYPSNSSVNNLIKTDVTDYSGLIDWVCMPCEMKHRYNSDNLLQSIENVSTGYIIDLEYE